ATPRERGKINFRGTETHQVNDEPLFRLMLVEDKRLSIELIWSLNLKLSLLD
ncbi:MAG: hypothetical protein RIS84_423, partial [Pseudomonadota bacterium]